MFGKITKIDPLKKSRNAKQNFVRVYFELKEKLDPKTKGDWSKTDLVPAFRNFPKWQPYLREGAVFKNLTIKQDKTVDADSNFVYLGG